MGCRGGQQKEGEWQAGPGAEAGSLGHDKRAKLVHHQSNLLHSGQGIHRSPPKRLDVENSSLISPRRKVMLIKYDPLFYIRKINVVWRISSFSFDLLQSPKNWENQFKTFHQC